MFLVVRRLGAVGRLCIWLGLKRSSLRSWRALLFLSFRFEKEHPCDALESSRHALAIRLLIGIKKASPLLVPTTAASAGGPRLAASIVVHAKNGASCGSHTDEERQRCPARPTPPGKGVASGSSRTGRRRRCHRLPSSRGAASKEMKNGGKLCGQDGATTRARNSRASVNF